MTDPVVSNIILLYSVMYTSSQPIIQPQHVCILLLVYNQYPVIIHSKMFDLQNITEYYWKTYTGINISYLAQMVGMLYTVLRYM